MKPLVCGAVLGLLWLVADVPVTPALAVLAAVVQLVTIAFRRITKTTGKFSGPSYSVAGDPVPTGFNTREKAEEWAAQLDTADAIDEARRGVTAPTADRQPRNSHPHSGGTHDPRTSPHRGPYRCRRPRPAPPRAPKTAARPSTPPCWV